jgi:hypothetical protein
MNLNLIISITYKLKPARFNLFIVDFKNSSYFVLWDLFNYCLQIAVKKLMMIIAVSSDLTIFFIRCDILKIRCTLTLCSNFVFYELYSLVHKKTNPVVIHFTWFSPFFLQ